MKCKLCKTKLKPNYKSCMIDNPVIGTSYLNYVSHYYCPECRIMYQGEVVNEEWND